MIGEIFDLDEMRVLLVLVVGYYALKIPLRIHKLL